MKPPLQAAVLTPPGTGAIAVVALRGETAWSVVRERFRPAHGELPATPQPGRTHWGRLQLDLSSEPASSLASSRAADEAILVVRETHPNVCIELHCHGGPVVVEWLLEGLALAGAVVVSDADWLRSLHGRSWSTEARIDLAHAPTVRTANILLDQVHGALDRSLMTIEESLANEDAATAETTLRRLLRYAPVGRHLCRPFRVVLAGPPNVGKSSLVNALAGYQRSVVSAQPGTTRDVVTTRLAFDGWPIELIDTAGQRAADDPLEVEGMARAEPALAEADWCLWLLDVTAEPIPPPPDWPTDRLSVIANKTDQSSVWPIERSGAVVSVSARTGAGLDALMTHIVERLVDPPSPGEAVPFRDELIAVLESTLTAVTARDWTTARQSMQGR